MTRVRACIVAGIILVVALVAASCGPTQSPPPASTVQSDVGGIQFTTLPGFVVERVTPAQKIDSLVAMTFDSLGRITVSKENEPPRLLLDTDRDGIFESERIVSDKIINCQGLWWDGPTLYAVGEGRGGENLSGTGLYKLTDTNGDGVAETFERVTPLLGSMGDHGPHAVRRGPDGHLRLHVGNMSSVPDTALDPGSPLRHLKEGQLLESYFDPRGHAVGVLAPGSQVYRYNPDKKTFSAMFAGMRNAYDHAYNLAGEAFTFDSDMEWDINLPWFKEVRTVHGVTGGDFGWRSGSRNLPDYQIDTLPPVRDLGRGSPVGIEFYHHSVYPKQFFDALFEADWSRGRLLYTGLTPNGATYKARDDRAEFVHGEPLNITDLEVAPDGMIYFSMGGRTTDGGVFRVRYTGPPNRTAEPKRILASVRQPQPLSSWGWAALEKQKESMGAAWAMELEQLARDGSADGQDRAQALYLLQRHGPAPSFAVLNQLIADRDVKVRAAVVYVAGNQHSDGARAIATTALEDGDPFVRRRALEALLVMGIEADKPGFAPVADVYRLLNDPDRVLRFIARVTLERMPRPQWQERVLNETNPLGALEGMVALVNTRPSPNEARALVGKQIEWMRRTDLSVEDQLRLQRAFQLTAIEAPGAITPHVRRQVHEALVARFPAQDERLNRQTALTLAYAGQPEAIGKILDAIPQGDENQPLQIHYVYALRAIKNGWTKEQKARLMNWFGKAVAWRGGASFAGYLNLMFDSSLKFFDPAEKKVAYEMVPLFKPVSEEELKAVLARQNRFGGGRPGGPPNPQAVARARIGANARARGVQVLSKEEILEYQLFVPVGERPNPAAGHVLYEKACGKCHRFGGIGTDFGPDLTTIASRFKKKDILESTLWPSKAISDQYPSTIIELKSGEIVNGLVSRETAQAIQVRTADSTDRPITIPKTQIKEQRQSSISTMPEGLLDEFNQVEIASLLAFLMGPPPGSTDRR